MKERIRTFLETVEDRQCPTMGTDGEKLYVNPEFVGSLTDLQLQELTWHEELHCLLSRLSSL